MGWFFDLMRQAEHGEFVDEIVRLRAEVERYHDTFNTLGWDILQQNELIESLQADAEAGRRLKAALPTTADGVTVVPEINSVWHHDFEGSTSHIYSLANGGRASWGGGAYERPISECYSTLEALRAAAGEEGEVDDE